MHQPVITNEEFCLSYEDTKTTIANAFTIIFTFVIYHRIDLNNYEYSRNNTNVNLHFLHLMYLCRVVKCKLTNLHTFTHFSLNNFSYTFFTTYIY